MDITQREFNRATERATAMPETLYRILMWPVLSLLITGGFHFTVEAIWPDLRTYFIPAVLAPLLLGYGIWVGVRSIDKGGNYITAIVGGAILGVLPIVLEIVGFGVILDRGVTPGVLSGVYGFSVILFGSLLGAGFRLSGDRSGGR